MNRSIWAAGVAVAALLPTMAFAQDRCVQQQDGRVGAGTIIGGIAGAVVGSNVAARDNRTEGAVVGGILGAVAGNAIARSSADCDRAYGYYDRDGQWHANDRRVDGASGYFDRDGRFVEGRPNGYYAEDGRWVASRDSDGYLDRDGRWVPASVNGYYDSRGQWVAGVSSGYYDNGRWVAGPARGYYDNRGRWVRGEAPGRRDARGVWVADAQPGYYDNGRWVAGETRGYYDSRGRWIATVAYAPEQRGYERGYERDRGEARRDRGDMWRGVGSGTREREAWLGQWIQTARNNGDLSRREAASALRTLNQIRLSDDQMRRRNRGQLGPRGAASINARLDALARTVRLDTRDDNRRPATYRGN
ncbi:MAG TPA: glycine zipper 2TM domain-containing protein [Caulobacter sp.]|nr:glycine zipper 2TM domain-containing protein [Caulobacter sp.]